MNSTIASIFTIFIYALIVAIIVRSLMTWFPNTGNSQFARILDQVTEPLLQPVRRIMPRTGMIDFSAMIVIVILFLMLQVIAQVSE